MNMGLGTARLGAILAIVAVASIVLLGTVLRLVDPLSSPVIPAEDPYTHMAHVREHLRTGDLSPIHAGADLYPPGLHAFLATVLVFTGADLHEIVRVGPAVFGAIGILGVALLLWRHAGPVPAVVGSLAWAVAPEAIFRTTMMSPTAQDLAILPFLLYALLELCAGRTAWAGVAAPLSLFLVFAHPWLFIILALTAATFVVLAYLLPVAASARARWAPRGVAASIAIVGGGLGLALTSCGGYCGPGFGNLFPPLAGQAWIAWVVIIASVTPLVALLARRNATSRFLERPPGRTMPWQGRMLVSGAIAASLGLATWMAIQQGLPEHVNLPRMLGWPILALGGFALVALPFLNSRLAHLAAGLFVATYPFVIFNPLASPFWPHRTAVFLGVSLVILAGLAAGSLARWAAQSVYAAAGSRSQPKGARTRLLLAAGAALLVASASVGTVYAGTPDGYPGGWSRLYPTCEYEALRDLSTLTDASPSALIIVGAWQPKLVLAALTADADRVWLNSAFYSNSDDRYELLAHLERQNRPVVVVVDRFLASEHPEADAGFLGDGTWQRVNGWCESTGTGQARLVAYQMRLDS